MPTRSTFESNSASSFSRSGDSADGVAMAPIGEGEFTTVGKEGEFVKGVKIGRFFVN